MQERAGIALKARLDILCWLADSLLGLLQPPWVHGRVAGASISSTNSQLWRSGFDIVEEAIQRDRVKSCQAEAALPVLQTGLQWLLLPR